MAVLEAALIEKTSLQITPLGMLKLVGFSPNELEQADHIFRAIGNRAEKLLPGTRIPVMYWVGNEWRFGSADGAQVAAAITQDNRQPRNIRLSPRGEFIPDGTTT